MCLPLIARILEIDRGMATVKLVGGEIVQVNTAPRPEADAGNYVLLDRGMVIDVISAEEAQEMLSFYTDLGDMLAEEDARGD
ncbi:(Ni-Fe)-hydrogenase assembly chaperone [Nitrolancea hollandica Lb]|uniref:(Ni-Fe)-hydrogenase assembly chaperone n=2 Tax=Nitrolancea hollandica TaxID=1206749 RepID=I4ED30_9BACT|nr:(Ni-Fe)-hydrogenase assembly chaperone [Nitrolancea hollandica Lb]